MKPYAIAAVVLAVLGLLGAGGYAIRYAIDKAATAESAATLAVDANKVTNITLERQTNATEGMVQTTAKLADKVGILARDTTKGLRALQGSMKDAKEIDLDSLIPADTIVPFCVQWAKASGYSAPMDGKAVPGAPLSGSSDAIAKQCRRAWARVTWRDLLEYIMPLMQHAGELRLQLKAGAEYYGPKVGNTMGKEK